ncbi:right-handed parallel beta-helix repeat-containing protein [Alkalihalobacillus clausii]|uniref:right-handed parallel beta-helix repeat-containing protein n=1 Tax=Shouchella clausii TaxID=79880 RepID=UPI001C236CAA|nr:right-handed parallel beta-helix repeat-containing protein [Shouchella clausii]MBU8597380.1 right-handed parallel beta-helix repeat-containing protein [Shouchella clausii]
MDLKRVGVRFDRVRVDLNENFDKIEGTYKGLQNRFDNAVDEVSERAFDKVVDRAKIDWLPPVDTFDDLATTYPDATEGQTVMTRDTGKIYRMTDGVWMEIQDIDPTAINDVDKRATEGITNLQDLIGSFPELLSNGKNLVEKIQNENQERSVNPEWFADWVVREDDWSPAFNRAVELIKAMGGGVLRGKGSYTCQTPLNYSLSDFYIDGRGMHLHFPNIGPEESAITIQGTRERGVAKVTSNISKGDRVIYVDNQVLEAGDYINIRSSGEVFNSDRPDFYIKAELAIVESVFGNEVTLTGGTYDSYNAVGYEVSIDKITPVKDVCVKDLKITGGGTGKTQLGLTFRNFVNATCDNVTIDDMEYGGVQFNIGWNAKLRDSTVRGSNQPTTGYGLWFHSIDGGVMTGNTGENNRHTVEISGNTPSSIARNITVAFNKCEDDIAAGISSHGGSEFIDIHNNYITKCNGGITSRGGSTTISNNKISNCKGTPITIGDGGDHPWGHGLAGTNLKIISNTIETGDREAVYQGIYILSSLKDAQIEGNIIKGFKSNGIFARGYEMENLVINDNMIDCADQTAGEELHGIYLRPRTLTQSKMLNIIIGRNRIANPNHAGIRIESDGNNNPANRVSISYDNVITNSGFACVQLTGYYDKTKVKDNFFASRGVEVHTNWATFLSPLVNEGNL